MKVLVVGEKAEHAAAVAHFIKQSIAPTTLYAAAFKAYGPAELSLLGGAGITKLFMIPDSVWGAGAAAAAAGLEQLARSVDADLIAFYASKKNNEVAARLAQRLDAGYAAEVLSLERREHGLLAKRLVLGGGYVASISLNGRPSVVSTKPSVEASEKGEKPEVESFSVDAKAPAVTFLETIKPEKGKVELEKASVLVAVGRGFKKKEDLAMAEELARLIGAEVGCSRPISGDLKWLEEERHIGLSGKRVRPSLYIAIGISGQVQHLVGMRDSKTVVAVNIDKNAPMATESDYYVVGDLYKILPRTIEIIKSKLSS